MRKYETPEMEVTLFDTTCIITESVPGGLTDGGVEDPDDKGDY